jgi:hypothetical protein
MKAMKQLMTPIMLLFTLISQVTAQEIDITNASILVSPGIQSPITETLKKIIKEEVEKRTAIRWPVTNKWKAETKALIAIVLSGDKKLAGEPVPQRDKNKYPEYKPEGYRVLSDVRNGKTIIWIIGSDARAAIFGVGFLLRQAIMRKNQCLFKGSIDYSTSPVQAIRGHQLGYRNTANSYDAWDARQYEQYIRELVLFGTNAVENIPFGDDDDSQHMPVPRQEMRIRISEICSAYDIDYWVWTPATFDLTDTEKRMAMLDKHEQFYRDCPKLDHVFFPGGDPGNNHPREVMPFLQDLSKRLVKYHPAAGVWISLQGFSAEQIDYFYTYLDDKKPEWLRGIVSGPSSPPIAETRYRLDERYQHRQYPDITHNVRCEFPVANWDQAFMLTIGREGINPRPNFTAKIHATFAPFTDGFSTYSDGVHDDVNKIIWSMRGWDITTDVREILTDYCRFFFGPELADEAADGILALEQNWIGPIKGNGGIETTFAFWQNLEKENPQLSGNWRWQQLVLRAYYDTYQRRRKIYEEHLEMQANTILALAGDIGAAAAMDQALAIVNKAETQPVAADLHKKIVSTCDDLFRSIGLQTSVQKYQASNFQRGCILDFVDYPLNNRWWLADEFDKIKAMESEAEKLARLKVIYSWENPGKGSYYDNISNIETGPRVLTTSYDACDVAWWEDGFSRARLSSQLFQWEPVLEYENLDFNGRYLIRICGLGEALIRIDGERLEPVQYNKGIGEFKEFVIPGHLTRDGHMRVTFDRPEESHLRWKDFSHVSDVWVIKR